MLLNYCSAAKQIQSRLEQSVKPGDRRHLSGFLQKLHSGVDQLLGAARLIDGPGDFVGADVAVVIIAFGVRHILVAAVHEGDEQGVVERLTIKSQAAKQGISENWQAVKRGTKA